jgi:hypothetical protein
MEMTQYFTTLVLGICAIHLVWTASAHISSWWNARTNNRSQKSAVNAGAVQQRSDWYAFFHCSDLYGPDSARKSNVSVQENRTRTPQKNQRPQIRPTAH